MISTGPYGGFAPRPYGRGITSARIFYGQNANPYEETDEDILLALLRIEAL